MISRMQAHQSLRCSHTKSTNTYADSSCLIGFYWWGIHVKRWRNVLIFTREARNAYYISINVWHFPSSLQALWLPECHYYFILIVYIFVWCALVGGGGKGVASYIWHSTGVRLEIPLFQRCQVYDKPPFSKKKVYDWPSFYIDIWMVSFSDIAV